MIPFFQSAVRFSEFRLMLVVCCLCVPLAACQHSKSKSASGDTKPAAAATKAPASAPAAATSSGSLTLAKKTPFAKGLSVPEAVRLECKLDEKLSEFVQSSAKGDYDRVELVDKVPAKSSGKVLVMQITGLTGTGGGAWTGPKFVTVEGTLWQDGKVAGNFRGTRYSSGGAWGGYKGTCAILGRCVKALGKDVAEWTKNPTRDAVLGDARK